MKAILYQLLVFVSLVSCSSEGSTTDPNLELFNKEFTVDQVLAYDNSLNYFDWFLEENYPKSKSKGSSMTLFLKDFLSQDSAKFIWKHDEELLLNIINDLEESGLRKEFKLYGHEQHDFLDSSTGTITVEIEEEPYILLNGEDSSVIEKSREKIERMQRESHDRWDKSLHFNRWGNYMNGLREVAKNEKWVADFVEAVSASNFTDPFIAANGALSSFSSKEFEDPIMKRILFSEVFYWEILNESKQ